MKFTLARRLASEGIGTGLLLAAVIGSGIMAERLSGGNVALALLGNTIATGASLVALILTFGAISGAHFNPAVTLMEAWRGGLSWMDAPAYCLAQIVGGLLGVLVAHGMFAVPLWQMSTHVRAGIAQAFSEFVAAFGLLLVIQSVARHRPTAVPYAVGAYIIGAYWFTASTSFANPAVTLARAFTDTFAGIRLADVPVFVGAQLVGAVSATALSQWMFPHQLEADEPQGKAEAVRAR